MVFEYMKYGDLAALLQSNDQCSGIVPRVKLTEVIIIIITRTMFMALSSRPKSLRQFIRFIW